MYRLLWLRLVLTLSLFAFLLGTPSASLAQSSIDLVVHYVQGQPAEDEIAYDVSVFLSVVDGAGNPVTSLTPDVFTVTEDSQMVEIKGLDKGQKEPINIVLVLDTSGSMGGTPITAAKTAASNFVDSLDPKDRVAVVIFNNLVTTQVDFTADHSIVKNELSGIDVVRGSGTCLYDAAYQAIQMSSTLPSGSRAVVLFTDGVDQTPTPGKVCSTHTTEDVIKLATDAGTRTPIYTLGLGKPDEAVLKRFAELSGGRYLYSPDATQLDSVFQRLAEQLRSQFVLTYRSVSGPGAHTLAVSANYSGAQDSDTRNFLLPALPTRITFVSPVDGSSVQDTLKIAVNLSGQGETVERVAFETDGKVIGTDDTVPYELDVDLSGYAAGNLAITAIAYGANNSELASRTVNVTIGGVAAPSGSVTPIEEDDSLNSPLMIVGIGAGGLLLVAIVLFVFFAVRRRRAEADNGTTAKQYVAAGYDRTSGGTREERTVDDWEMSPDALGMLIVEASDDTSMVGHRFEIRQTVTTIGRSTENDVTFPKDKPVSRRHAEIVKKAAGLYLMEVESTDETGQSKRPTYGTFINDVQLSGDAILLQTGDEIRLGKRVRMKFEGSSGSSDSESATYDGIMGSDDPDRTYDQR